MSLFRTEQGMIPACDVDTLDRLEWLVEATSGLEFIEGYKIGMNLVVKNGIHSVTELIRKHSDRPIIYDHQKFGTDIPDTCSGKILDVLRDAGIQGVIIFPQAGKATLAAAVEGCKERGLIPIVGGEMTHPQYLVREGGYIADDAPERMYGDAGELGATHFVVPGTKPERIRHYRDVLASIIKEPRFLFPGVGKGQGGDIAAAFDAAAPFPGYAIVGRGIYGESDPAAAAARLWASATNKPPRA